MWSSQLSIIRIFFNQGEEMIVSDLVGLCQSGLLNNQFSDFVGLCQSSLLAYQFYGFPSTKLKKWLSQI